MQYINDIKMPYYFVLTLCSTLLCCCMLGIGLLSAFVAFIVKRNKGKKKIIATPAPVFRSIDVIKREYLAALSDLEKLISEGKIQNRQIFQKISVILRGFIGEAKKILTLSKTKKELEPLQMEYLNSMIDSCYKVEFTRESPKVEPLEFISSIKKYISEWN